MRTRSFSFEVIFAFLSLLIVTVMVIIWYSYRTTSRTIHRLSGDLINQVNRTIVEKTRSYLSPAEQMVKLASRLQKGDLNKLTSNKELEAMMLQILQLYPQLTIFSLGDEKGNFLMLKRMSDGTIASKEIQRLTDQTKVIWRYRNKQGEIVETAIVPFDGFDPRVRNWYKGAEQQKDTYWTDVYIFFTDKSPGITASQPVLDSQGNIKAVFGLDIRLAEISHFLKNQKVGDNGTVFILNPQGKIVAHPDADIQVHQVNNSYETASAEDIDEKASIAYKQNQATQKNRFNFVADGEPYIASFQDFPENFNKRWTIVVLVPENDFVGSIKETNLLSLLFSLFILLIAILFALIISRKISKPIIDLTRETDKIKRFELDNDIKIDSSIREIRQMVTAIDAMKKGLSSFKRYVPANLVRQLIESGEEARVGGQEKDISIMFTDIKSFTSISERTAPQEIMVQLSEYFEELTEIILNANGTIDKFIGDSIMAFWGAPLDDPKHPQRVCQAALEMHHKLDELNEKWEREGKARLQTRIGIHTGSSIVGNIGSSDRLNYTILGDSVNLASRLEGINKQYGTSIIASERLKKLCQDDYVFRPIDEVPVKGKSQTFLIYELIGKRANAAPDTIKKADAFETAWELIQNGEWDRAKECIKDYAEDADPLYYLYMEHCDKGIDADED